MRNFFRCITVIAAIGYASVFLAELQPMGSSKAWAGQHANGQHNSVLRIAESDYFPLSKKLRIGLSKSMKCAMLSYLILQ